MSVCKSAPAPSKALLLLESRALPEFSAFCLMRPWLSLAPRGDGHPVLVLPGLLADDASTRPLRDFLKSQGYRVHGWKQGRNCGLRQNVESDMVARVDAHTSVRPGEVLRLEVDAARTSLFDPRTGQRI